jgi:hypothetical protein
MERQLLATTFYYQRTATKKNPGVFWYSRQYIRQLSNADTIFADGTFYASPVLFKQLYTIHALIEVKRMNSFTFWKTLA